MGPTISKILRYSIKGQESTINQRISSKWSNFCAYFLLDLKMFSFED